ncbi:DUF6864 domain-containing function [Marinicauda salina]|uniref:DUF6864 domain-containing function n=1 Tax=Marinicauda salina TaxID=2135793 RepID=UPI0038CBF4A9
MAFIDSDLPFPVGTPEVTASAEGNQLASSGVILIRGSSPIHLQIGAEAEGLHFTVSFDDEAEEHGVELKKDPTSDVRAELVLKKFNNTLGTVFGPARVGSLNGSSIILGLSVHQIGEARQILYSVFTGGADE